jgi:biotin-dependent carboxylase-like uncharacterized protein
MDPLALQAGNLLLGNPRDSAAIEVQVFPFQVRFGVARTFAVTGADCGATLDGVPLLPWWVHRAEPGQVLHLSMPQRGNWRASRAYLCVQGGIDVPSLLGSRSTQLRGAFGGFEGRTLRQGDQLPVAAERCEQVPIDAGVVPPALDMPHEIDGAIAIRALPASEHDEFTLASRDAFWSSPWKITPQADRYGYRFSGPTLRRETAAELRSHGIVPGVIQVPHGGQPIVQMREAQPSGGYPKIATVIDADLWRLGQAPIGSQIRFVETSWDAALAAADEVEEWLKGVERAVKLQRVMKENA